jgi:hypothetical protein
MAAYNAFKKILKEAGLDPKLYALHSPRVGATTDSFAMGIPGHIIDIRGRWKSSKTKERYCRPSEREWMAVYGHKTSRKY